MFFCAESVQWRRMSRAWPPAPTVKTSFCSMYQSHQQSGNFPLSATVMTTSINKSHNDVDIADIGGHSLDILPPQYAEENHCKDTQSLPYFFTDSDSTTKQRKQKLTKLNTSD